MNLLTSILVDLFTACTKQEVKDNIIQSFCDPHGRLQIVIAAVAFGMGLHCPNVWTVRSLEEYLQETCRAGRDGSYSTAVLYYSKKISHFLQVIMQWNDIVSTILFQEFESFECDDTTDSVTTSFHCTCCDICEITSYCDLCM